MATPTPPGGGNNPLNALVASLQAQAAANAQAMTAIQALAHMQQTYNPPTPGPTPGGQPQQPQGLAGQLLGGHMPTPMAPTASWLKQQAMQFVSQSMLGVPAQRNNSGATAAQQTGPGNGYAGPQQAPVPWAQRPGGQPVPVVGGMPWAVPGGYAQPQMYMGGGSPGYGGVHGGGGGPGYPGQPGGGGHGSWANMLPMIGARFGPWGAVAGYAAKQLTKLPAEIRSQRDKNAYYQSVEGGSNFSGFGERASEELYRWTTFGVFSSDEARQAFKGVTRLGYNSADQSGGPTRQDALNFAYHGKTAYGATVGESLQELQTATNAAVTNFKDLSTALKNVSDDAGKAGINAQMMRGELTQAMGVAANNGFAGNSALGAATLQTGMITQLGRNFQGADFSNRTSPGYQMLASAIAGVTPAQYITGNQSFQAGVQARTDAAFASQVLTPQITKWINDQVNQATGGKPTQLSADQAMEIGKSLLVQFFPQPQALVAVLGPSLPANMQDANHAAQWLVQEVAKQSQGGIAGAANAQTNQASAAQLAHLHDVNGVVTGVGPYSRIKLPGRGGKTGNSATVITPGSGAAWGAYNSWAKGNGGQEDMAVAHILSAFGNDSSAQVVVTTASGKRVVSLEDAVKNHRDELATGNVAIVGGKDAGKSITDVVGQDKLDPTRNFSAEAKGGDTSGQTLAQWQKQNVKANGAIQSGGVTITLSNDARRLLAVMDTTGVAGGAASASPPSNPFATFPSLPGVGG